MIKLKVLTEEHMPIIVHERNQIMETLRTPFMLNDEMQKEWFKKEICNRDSKTRYWAIYDSASFCGYGGIENIQWENRLAEISLLIFENFRGVGRGHMALTAILDQAFNYINLENVWGECYNSNKAGMVFWEKIVEKYDSFLTYLPNRKYFNGEYYGSHYFNISKEQFNKVFKND